MTATNPLLNPAQHSSEGHEDRDINARGIILTGVVLAVIIGSSVGTVARLMHYLARHAAPVEDSSRLPAAVAMPLPADLRRPQLPEDILAIPQPRLQLSQEAAMEALRRRESEILNSYGWIDQPSGIARIPIQRAMELLADPAWEGQRGIKVKSRLDREKLP